MAQVFEEVAALSMLDEDGIITGRANPIYLTSPMDYRRGARVTFEVLESDAKSLKKLVGKMGTFGLDPQRPLFNAELTSLDSCTSTVQALSLMRQEPAMRGVLTVHGAVDLKKPC